MPLSSSKSTYRFRISSSLYFTLKYKSVYLNGSDSSKSITKSMSELSLKSYLVTEPNANNDFTLLDLQSSFIWFIFGSSIFIVKFTILGSVFQIVLDITGIGLGEGGDFEALHCHFVGRPF